MSEDDETGPIQDQIDAYKKQLDSLRDDFSLLVRWSDIAFAQIKSIADGAGPMNVDPALREKCRSFVEKYTFVDRYRC